MIKSFFKVAIRNIIRQKLYSLINILGLAIGMACSILIFLYVIDEISYDKHHENADNLYRIGIQASFQGIETLAYVTGSPVGKALVDEVPEVINSSRIVRGAFDETETVVTIENINFIEDRLFYVDSTFLDLFTVEFLEGSPDEALNKPYQILITESVALKYFSSTKVLGKSLTINSNEYTISGVIEDCPSKTHFHYDLLASIVSSPVANYTTWVSNDMSYTYLLLEDGADPDEVLQKINKVAKEQVENEFQSSLGLDLETFYSSGNYFTYIMQPVTDIHLHSHTDFEIEPNSNIIYVYIFSIIAFFILIVACVNFMNLSTARSAKRAREVGIRKVVGGHRKNLFFQFLFESVIMSTIALFFAMIFIESVLPYFNNFVSKSLSLNYFSNILVIPSLLLLAIVVGLFSGLYSAKYLSSIRILSVLKSSVFSGKSHSWFRNMLVVFQFTVSVGLFICTFIIYSQLNYIMNKDVGFDKKNIVVINRASRLNNSFEAFKQELMNNPVIENVSYSNTIPARMFGGFPCSLEGEGSNKTFVPRLIRTDHNFKETYNLEMKEGRFFSDDFSTDSFTVIINESFAEELGVEPPFTGKYITTQFGGPTLQWKILGVVKNFNYRSLHQEVGSLVLLNPSFMNFDFVSVKVKDNISKEALGFIEDTWNQFVTNAPFTYYILEDDFNNLHKEEFKTGELFTIFSILAIVIACLGLFGLASFIAEQKTKEIGIRKSLGASSRQILFLLSKQFTIWILISNLIAWPLAYILMNKWLQNFEYHVNIKLWIFIASGALSLLLAWITVIYKSVAAARTNPVDSLRYE